MSRKWVHYITRSRDQQLYSDSRTSSNSGGLFALALVICSTNAGEGLVKLVTCSDVHGHWIDMWRSGTLQVIMSVLLITTTDHKVTSGSLGDHPRWNVPLLHTSTQPLGTSLLSQGLPPCNYWNWQTLGWKGPGTSYTNCSLDYSYISIIL